eukprot:315493-Chlamydomonas_euryale.AAC.1
MADKEPGSLEPKGGKEDGEKWRRKGGGDGGAEVPCVSDSPGLKKEKASVKRRSCCCKPREGQGRH